MAGEGAMHEALVTRIGLDVARIAEAALRHRVYGEEALARLMAAVARHIEPAVAAGRSAGERAPACGPGCASCCTVNVATLAVEGAAAAAFLRIRLPAEDARKLAAGLLEFHDRIRWLEDGERIRARLACPFLDEHRTCAIHPVRPLACRSLTSLDPADCRRAIAERADDEGPGLVRINVLQKLLHDEAIEALASVLRARGLDARCRDVSGMTAVFLADPAQAAAFAAGGRLPIE
jgi:putative zinc- or iron-chelating protein